MNEALEIANLTELLDFINRRAVEGKPVVLTPLLIKLEELRASINRGCNCRKKARSAHAEAVYKEAMIHASVRDKSELSELLGVGKDRESVIIKSAGQILLRLGS